MVKTISPSVYVSLDEVFEWLAQGGIAYLHLDNRIVRVGSQYAFYEDKTVTKDDFINGKWQLVSRGFDRTFKARNVQYDKLDGVFSFDMERLLSYSKVGYKC